jgi:hypothetical protein
MPRAITRRSPCGLPISFASPKSSRFGSRLQRDAVGYGEGLEFELGEVIPTEPKAQSSGPKARQARIGRV